MTLPKFKTFGEWLSYWRHEFDLSQADVAKVLDKTPQHVSSMERAVLHAESGAVATPSIFVLAKLAKLFKRPIGEPISLILGTKQIDIPEVILDEIDLKGGTRKEIGLLNQQAFKLHSLFLQMPAERRPFVLELMELLLTGTLAASFNRALDDALTSPTFPENEEDLEQLDEQGRKPA